jgi:hypothetical protein
VGKEPRRDGGLTSVGRQDAREGRLGWRRLAPSEGRPKWGAPAREARPGWGAAGGEGRSRRRRGEEDGSSGEDKDEAPGCGDERYLGPLVGFGGR